MPSAVQLNQKQKCQKQNRAEEESAFFVGSVVSEGQESLESQVIYFYSDYGYMIFKIKKNNPLAKIPAYALPGDAGMDLYSVEDKILKPMGLEQIHTGIEIELPPKMAGLVWAKSGLATKYGITVMGGVFDENYRGELIVSLINLSNKDYHIHTGDKIAQLLIQQIEHPEVREVSKLSLTIRGKSRLGSTGKS